MIGQQRVLVVFYVVLALVGTVYQATNITGSPLNPDAEQNVRMASHLAHYGILSYDKTEPPRKPTMRREPVPIFALTAWILMNPVTADARPFTELFEGEPLVSVKGVNLFWVFFTYVGLCLLVYAMFEGLIWRVVVPPLLIVLTNYSLLDEYVNRLNTEAVAACFLVWAAFFSFRFVRAPSIGTAIAMGLSFALLALTKAIYFYVAIAAFPIIAWIAWENSAPAARHLARVTAVAALSFLMVVGLWSTRNLVQLGEFRIADRGGDILSFRTLLMEQPISGALYAFSPLALRDQMSDWTGYQEIDLKPGGRIEGLGKDEEVSLKKRRWDIYRDRMEEEDLELSRNRAQSWLTKEALGYYLSNPSAYLVWPAVFAYRGGFFMTPQVKPKSPTSLIGALLLVGSFLIVAIVTLALRRESSVVFLLPLGGYFFYILFTHSMERYHEPIVPFVWLAVIWTIYAIVDWHRNWRRSRSGKAALVGT